MLARLLVTLSTITLSSAALAQSVAPLPMGGRSGAMGGTGAAVGRDSAMGYLNPAGLAAVDKDTLSMSLSAYQLDALRVDDFFAAPDAMAFGSGTSLEGNQIRQSTFRAIPTALSYVLHLGSEGQDVLTFSILNPRASKMELEGALHATTLATTFDDRASYVSELSTLYIGPSYATRFGGDALAVRVGASAYVAYSSYLSTLSTETMAGMVPASQFAEQRLTRFTSGSSFELLGVIGAQAELGMLRVGASFQSPSVHLGGTFESSGRLSAIGNGALAMPDTLSQVAESGDYEERLPWRAVLGVGIEAGDFTVAIDGTYVSAVGDYHVFQGTSSDTQLVEGQTPINTTNDMAVLSSQREVLGVSLGIEWRATPALALRLGGFTDFSATEMPAADAMSARQLFMADIDHAGGSIGLGFRTGAAETSLALTYVGGIGKMVGLNVGNYGDAVPDARPVDVVSSRIALMLSGAVELEDLFN